MLKAPPDPSTVSLAELVSDPIVQILMLADNVTAQELAALFETMERSEKQQSFRLRRRAIGAASE
jgi:hypothetical protein